MKRRRLNRSALLLSIALQAGCATVATIQSVDERSARVFSGTRLDFLAIAGLPIPPRSFRVDPPPYPWLDLPFSLALDILVLPLTFGFGVNISR